MLESPGGPKIICRSRPAFKTSLTTTTPSSTAGYSSPSRTRSPAHTSGNSLGASDLSEVRRVLSRVVNPNVGRALPAALLLQSRKNLRHFQLQLKNRLAERLSLRIGSQG